MVDQYYGQNRPYSATGSFESSWFMIQQLINRINGATLVKVAAITTTGAVAPVGTMDVIPLVNMVDGAANISKHGTVRNIIYARMQGGDKAVILDPKVGDLGIAVFCDRDISSVRSTKDQAPPGSKRRFDMADGVWVMAVLGAAPKTYVRFTDGGALILSDGQSDADKPMQCIVAKDYVQMQKKGEPTLHVTVDAKGNQIVAGMTIVTADNPFPDPPP